MADSANFSLLSQRLGQDVKGALRVALAARAVFPGHRDPLAIFRATLADSIRDIERHPRGALFREFLSKGPYVDSGSIPRRLKGDYLSDEDVARVTAFVHSFMVNSFKGAVAELLAVGAITSLVTKLQRTGVLPPGSRVFVGDAVCVRGIKSDGWRKGADLHLLMDERSPRDAIRLIGVAEVKSYFKSALRLQQQLDQHIRRARRGLRLGEVVWPGTKVRVGRDAVRIAVTPSDWTLPRSFRFRKRGEGRRLEVMAAVPPSKSDAIEQTGPNDWRITLRWSKEAIAEAAYEMTFWYMGKVGEHLYSNPKYMPPEWGAMTAADAGRNAAKMMLYYAILRARTIWEHQRAIALYNSYGFGYALGMNYRDAEGRREMLWPKDLDEIARNKKTTDGCRIVGLGKEMR